MSRASTGSGQAANTTSSGGAGPSATGSRRTSSSMPSTSTSSSGSGQAHSKRLAQLEAKLQQQMDAEDRRVKLLTEGILYDFLPAALAIMMPQQQQQQQQQQESQQAAAPPDGMGCDAWQLVAGAALSLSALMNAPPGFLEFLLCIPWHCLQPHDGLPSSTSSSSSSSFSSPSGGKQEAGDAPATSSSSTISSQAAHMQLDEQARRRLVNTRIHPALLAPLVEFLYRPVHADSVPPVLQLGGKGRQGRQQPPEQPQDPLLGDPLQQPKAGDQQQAAQPAELTPEAVTALLDGATSLHCAALRGNPAAVDHLLRCGGDPGVRTAAGQLPLHLVPVCGHKLHGSRKRVCQCLSHAEQEVWECRSGLARALLARKCLLVVSAGLRAWFRLMLLAVVVLMGCLPPGALISHGAISSKPQVQEHLQARRRSAWQQAQAGVLQQVQRLRAAAAAGRAALDAALQIRGSGGLAAAAAAGAGGAAGDSINASAAASSSSSSSGLIQACPTATIGAAQGGVCTGGSAVLEQPCSQGASGSSSGSSLYRSGAGCAASKLHSISTVSPFQEQLAQSSAGCAQPVPPAAAATPAAAPPPPPAGGGAVNGTQHECAMANTGGVAFGWSTVDKAQRHFTEAVHMLQQLQLSSCGLPVALASFAAESSELQQEACFKEDEQAQLYCWWAQAGLLKLSMCGCAGCTSIAVRSVRGAHAELERLHEAMGRQRTVVARLCNTQRRALQQQQQQGEVGSEQGAGSRPTVAGDGATGPGETQQHGGTTIAPPAAAPPPAAPGGAEPAPAGAAAAAAAAAEAGTDALPGSSIPAWPQFVEVLQRSFRVAEAFRGVLLAHAELLLVTDARAPLTRAALARAQHCLREWRAVQQLYSLLLRYINAPKPAADASYLSSKGLGPMGKDPAVTGPGAAAGICTSTGVAANSALSGAAAVSEPPAASQQQQQQQGKARVVGATGPAELDMPWQVRQLQLGARTMECDIMLAEAITGYQLAAEETLVSALDAAVVEAPNGTLQLARPVNASVLEQLQAAHNLGVAASKPMALFMRQLLAATAAELEAEASLQQLLKGRAPAAAPAAAADHLQGMAQVMQAAAAFPRLQQAVEEAQQLYSRSSQRVASASKLADTMARIQAGVSGVTLTEAPVGTAASSSNTHAALAAAGAGGVASGGKGGGSSTLPDTKQLAGYCPAVWQGWLGELHAAAEEAKQLEVAVDQAKRLAKDLNAQVAAAEAAAAADLLLARSPAGSAALRAMATRLEAAAAAITPPATAPSAVGMGVTQAPASSTSNSAVCGAAAFQELLAPRVAACKRRCEVERAAEELHRAAAACRTLADLPKLEAAILTARKLGAEELDPPGYARASEQRVLLTDAARARTSLDAALRQLSKSGRVEDAEGLERAVQEAGAWEGLLGPEISRAREALEAWRSRTASEAKLSRALAEGAGAAQLARAIQEASSSGLKVAGAKRVHKLVQGLEQAMASVAAAAAGDTAGAAGGSVAAAAAMLRGKIEAAEGGGVSASLLSPAKRLLTKLLLRGAQEVLEAALKQRGGAGGGVSRIAGLRAALAQAEGVLGTTAAELAAQTQDTQNQQQQQQQDEEEEGAHTDAGAEGPQEEVEETEGEQQDGGQQQQVRSAAAAPPPPPAAAAPAEGEEEQIVADMPHSAAPRQPSGVTADKAASSLTTSSVGASDTASVTSSSQQLASCSSSTRDQHLSRPATSGGSGARGVGLRHAASDASLDLPGVAEADPALAEEVARLMVGVWQRLLEDQAEEARMARERAEEERARREQVERDRAERQRQESERDQNTDGTESARARAESRTKPKKLVWTAVTVPVGDDAVSGGTARSSAKPHRKQSQGTAAGAAAAPSSGHGSSAAASTQGGSALDNSSSSSSGSRPGAASASRRNSSSGAVPPIGPGPHAAAGAAGADTSSRPRAVSGAPSYAAAARRVSEVAAAAAATTAAAAAAPATGPTVVEEVDAGGMLGSLHVTPSECLRPHQDSAECPDPSQQQQQQYMDPAAGTAVVVTSGAGWVPGYSYGHPSATGYTGAAAAGLASSAMSSSSSNWGPSAGVSATPAAGAAAASAAGALGTSQGPGLSAAGAGSGWLGPGYSADAASAGGPFMQLGSQGGLGSVPVSTWDATAAAAAAAAAAAVVEQRLYPPHARTHSLEILGDLHAKLGSGLLADLGGLEAQSNAQHLHSQQQQQVPGGYAGSVPGFDHAAAAAAGAAMGLHGSGQMQPSAQLGPPPVPAGAGLMSHSLPWLGGPGVLQDSSGQLQPAPNLDMLVSAGSLFADGPSLMNLPLGSAGMAAPAPAAAAAAAAAMCGNSSSDFTSSSGRDLSTPPTAPASLPQPPPLAMGGGGLTAAFGAYSSFAFGAPGSSAFGGGLGLLGDGMRRSSSSNVASGGGLGQAANMPPTTSATAATAATATAAAAAAGSGVVPPGGDSGLSSPVPFLPEDLSFSPPSSTPEDRLPRQLF